jgi:hypothetical protein
MDKLPNDISFNNPHYKAKDKDEQISTQKKELYKAQDNKTPFIKPTYDSNIILVLNGVIFIISMLMWYFAKDEFVLSKNEFFFWPILLSIGLILYSTYRKSNVLPFIYSLLIEVIVVLSLF